jgi:ornithine--oxo-acid transaminase
MMNARKSFGPFTAGFIKIPYDDVDALEAVLNSQQRLLISFVEPIQGEAGVYVQVKGIWQSQSFMCSTMFIVG